MSIIAKKIILKSIEAAYAEAGRIYLKNPDEILHINAALTRITLDLNKMIDDATIREDEDVEGLWS